MNKQTGLLWRETSWTKRTDIPLTPMKRPSTKPSLRKNRSRNTQTPTSQTDSTNWTDQRTGHNRLNAHMYSKFKVGESDMCPCNADIKTAEHLLQHCQLHDALRQDMWPEPKYHWGTSSMATWRSWGRQPLSWGQQASVSSIWWRRRPVLPLLPPPPPPITIVMALPGTIPDLTVDPSSNKLAQHPHFMWNCFTHNTNWDNSDTYKA